jgi:hypothetical protein
LPFLLESDKHLKPGARPPERCAVGLLAAAHDFRIDRKSVPWNR